MFNVRAGPVLKNFSFGKFGNFLDVLEHFGVVWVGFKLFEGFPQFSKVFKCLRRFSEALEGFGNL